MPLSIMAENGELLHPFLILSPPSSLSPQHFSDVLSSCTSQRRRGCFQGVICCTLLLFFSYFIFVCSDPRPTASVIQIVFLLMIISDNRGTLGFKSAIEQIIHVSPHQSSYSCFEMQLLPVNQPCSCMTLHHSSAAMRQDVQKMVSLNFYKSLHRWKKTHKKHPQAI